MFYKSSSDEFTDRPSFSSDSYPSNEDRFEMKDRLIDEWQQLDWVDQVGNNLDNLDNLDN